MIENIDFPDREDYLPDMFRDADLEDALTTLGQVLQDRDEAYDVAAALDLEDDWLNPGPAGLVDLGLPDGFEERATVRIYGTLTIRLAAVEDLIAFKLYAAADHWPDQSRHLADLRRLGPTPDALVATARWCRTHDPSEGFRDMLLLPVLAELGVEDPNV